MNENIDLTKILKDCPKGFKLYTPLFGEVTFKGINNSIVYPITVSNRYNNLLAFSKRGLYYDNMDGECVLFSSKDQRDWSKFTAPWYKKERFDPKTLKPFDRVLIKDVIWGVGIFSHYNKNVYLCYYSCECVGGIITKYCIPYNDDTKHLVGTTEEAPEYYRYWEE